MTATALANLGAMELKGDDADPADIVLKGLDDFKASVDDRLKALETKANDNAERIGKAEAAQKRSGLILKGDNTDLERKALDSFLRTGNETELKAAASDNDPAGGYFVLPTVDLNFRTLLRDLSPMRGLAEVVTVSSASYERFYSLTKRGAQRVVERDDRPEETARPDLIKQIYGVGEYYAAPTITRQALEDASIDLGAWLVANAAQDFAETEGEDFLNYSGANGFPRGLFDYGTTAEKDFTRAWGKHQHVAAGHASAPTDKQISDALIKLAGTLRRPYKGNARFLMNGNTAIRLRQIVDSANRYLWAPTGNMIEGVDHPLLGYPVEIDENMPDIGADALPIAFGDFRQGYVIVDRQGIRTEIDRVTQKGRVIFDIYKRVGGGAGDFNAIKFLKIATA